MSDSAPIGPGSVLDSMHRGGTVGGPIVVFVHGSMDRQGSFANVRRHLADVESVAYDRRGYARSRHVPGPFGIDQHTDDLLGVLDTLRSPGRRTVVVGHSFGGVVALAAAARAPGLIDGLAVHESPMSWEPWWSRSSGGAVALELADRPEDAAERFLRRFIGDERWDRLPERTRVARRAEGVVLVNELASLRLGRPYEFESIRCRVRVGVGTRAGEHMQRGMRLLADRCGELVVFEGAHHNAHSSRASEFADRLIRPLLTS